MEKQYVNVPQWKHRLLVAGNTLLLGAILFGAGASLVWLKASNEGLYEKRAELQTQVEQLHGQIEDLKAEGELLKSAALEQASNR